MKAENATNAQGLIEWSLKNVRKMKEDVFGMTDDSKYNPSV